MFESTAMVTAQASGNRFADFDFWVNLLGTSTAMLAAFFTIALAIIAMLTWKHNELRKKAEEEVQKTIKLGNDMLRLASSLTRLKEEQTKIVAETKKLLSFASKDAGEIKHLVSQVKKRDANVDEIEKQIKKRAQAVQSSLNSLASISKYTPGDIATKAKQDFVKAALERLTKPDQERDREIIQEALRQRVERLK